MKGGKYGREHAITTASASVGRTHYPLSPSMTVLSGDAEQSGPRDQDATTTPGSSSTAVGVVVRVRPLSTVELADPAVRMGVQCLKDVVIIGTGRSASVSGRGGGSPVPPAEKKDENTTKRGARVGTGDRATRASPSAVPMVLSSKGRRGSLARPQQFQVDQVFHPHSSQIEVYEKACRRIIEGVFQGVNGAILAYGATGAGKTHTMFGGAMSAAGIVYQSMQDIFAEKSRLEEEEGKTVTVKVSFVEIYNEEVYDLLTPSTNGSTLPPPPSSHPSASSTPGHATQSPPPSQLSQPPRKQAMRGPGVVQHTTNAPAVPTTRAAAAAVVPPRGSPTPSYAPQHNVTKGKTINGRQPLKVREGWEEDATGTSASASANNNELLTISGLTYAYPQSVDEFARAVERGHTQRFVASTAANAASSRSHAIITVEVTIREAEGGGPDGVAAAATETLSAGTSTTTAASAGVGGEAERAGNPHQSVQGNGGKRARPPPSTTPPSAEGTVARVRFCDLAGSERAAATSNSGIRLREGGSINRSLLALGAVVQGLVQCQRYPNRHTFIPYRGSKLTRLLRDGIGGNCNTQMLFCLNPSSQQYDENVNTMLFAMQAKEIEVVARRNAFRVVDSAQVVKSQEALIEELRGDLAAAREEVQRLSAALSAGPGERAIPRPVSAHSLSSTPLRVAEGAIRSSDSSNPPQQHTSTPRTPKPLSSTATSAVPPLVVNVPSSATERTPRSPMYECPPRQPSSLSGAFTAPLTVTNASSEGSMILSAMTLLPTTQSSAVSMHRSGATACGDNSSSGGGGGENRVGPAPPFTYSPATLPFLLEQINEDGTHRLLAASAPSEEKSDTVLSSGASPPPAAVRHGSQSKRLSVFAEGSVEFTELGQRLKTVTVEKDALYLRLRDAQERLSDSDIALRELKWKLARFLASSGTCGCCLARGGRRPSMASSVIAEEPAADSGSTGDDDATGKTISSVGVAGLRQLIHNTEEERQAQQAEIAALQSQLDVIDQRIASIRQDFLLEKQHPSLELLLDNARLRQSCTEAECLAAQYHQNCRTTTSREGEYRQALAGCVSAIRSLLPLVPVHQHHHPVVMEAQLALLYAALPLSTTDDMLSVFEAALRASNTPPLAPSMQQANANTASASVAETPTAPNASAGVAVPAPFIAGAAAAETLATSSTAPGRDTLADHFRELEKAAASVLHHSSPYLDDEEGGGPSHHTSGDAVGGRRRRRRGSAPTTMSTATSTTSLGPSLPEPQRLAVLRSVPPDSLSSLSHIPSNVEEEHELSRGDTAGATAVQPPPSSTPPFADSTEGEGLKENRIASAHLPTRQEKKEDGPSGGDGRRAGRRYRVRRAEAFIRSRTAPSRAMKEDEESIILKDDEDANRAERATRDGAHEKRTAAEAAEKKEKSSQSSAPPPSVEGAVPGGKRKASGRSQKLSWAERLYPQPQQAATNQPPARPNASPSANGKRASFATTLSPVGDPGVSPSSTSQQQLSQPTTPPPPRRLSRRATVLSGVGTAERFRRIQTDSALLQAPTKDRGRSVGGGAGGSKGTAAGNGKSGGPSGLQTRRKDQGGARPRSRAFSSVEAGDGARKDATSPLRAQPFARSRTTSAMFERLASGGGSPPQTGGSPIQQRCRACSLRMNETVELELSAGSLSAGGHSRHASSPSLPHLGQHHPRQLSGGSGSGKRTASTTPKNGEEENNSARVALSACDEAKPKTNDFREKADAPPLPIPLTTQSSQRYGDTERRSLPTAVHQAAAVPPARTAPRESRNSKDLTEEWLATLAFVTAASAAASGAPTGASVLTKAPPFAVVSTTESASSSGATAPEGVTVTGQKESSNGTTPSPSTTVTTGSTDTNEKGGANGTALRPWLRVRVARGGVPQKKRTPNEASENANASTAPPLPTHHALYAGKPATTVWVTSPSTLGLSASSLMMTPSERLLAGQASSKASVTTTSLTHTNSPAVVDADLLLGTSLSLSATNATVDRTRNDSCGVSMGDRSAPRIAKTRTAAAKEKEGHAEDLSATRTVENANHMLLQLLQEDEDGAGSAVSGGSSPLRARANGDSNDAAKKRRESALAREPPSRGGKGGGRRAFSAAAPVRSLPLAPSLASGTKKEGVRRAGLPNAASRPSYAAARNKASRGGVKGFNASSSISPFSSSPQNGTGSDGMRSSPPPSSTGPAPSLPPPPLPWSASVSPFLTFNDSVGTAGMFASVSAFSDDLEVSGTTCATESPPPMNLSVRGWR